MVEMLSKYTFDSEKKGYNILFLGAVHGNEQAGTKAIYKVVTKFASKALMPLKGCVSFIPICNPRAFENNVRQIDENLNRILKKYDVPVTYEQQIANELVTYIQNADVIIDLHSTAAKNTEPFIFNDYPDNFSNGIIAAQNVKYIVEGWPEIYALSDNIKDFSTGYCAHQAGKCCLTFECGNHYDEITIQNAYYAIMNTLLFFGVVEGYPAQRVEQKTVVMDSLYIKQKEGSLIRDFKHLDSLKQGELIAIYSDGTEIYAPYDCFILLPKCNAAINSEWFYLGSLKL